MTSDPEAAQSAADRGPEALEDMVKEMFPEGKAREVFPGWGLDGAQLHSGDPLGVAPDLWCVSRDDFNLLRKQIKEAVRRGIVQPTERDRFDPKDRKTGPSMYSVVDSFIKPLTRVAGGMSWALLRHPQGLACDIFITHCWAEGAYEFIDKVLAAWPSSKKKGAWCCIIANPQNLDISHFLREPRSSPFAIALKEASHMMVVSTRKLSIYTRIWCIYEAFLAVTLRKDVFLACKPEASWLEGCISILFIAFVVLDMVMGQAHKVIFVPARVVFYLIAGFSEIQMERRQREVETGDLQKGYTSVAEAQASQEEDKRRILGEIGDDVEKVDEAVELLQRIGMFTPSLRLAMDRQVNFRGKGALLFPTLVFQAWFISVLWIKGWYTVPIASISLGYIWVAFYSCRASVDARVFTRSIIINFATWSVGTATVAYTVDLLWRQGDHLEPVLMVNATCTILAAILVGLGVARTAAIPVVGPSIAGALWPGFWSSRCGCKFAAGSTRTASRQDCAAGQEVSGSEARGPLRLRTDGAPLGRGEAVDEERWASPRRPC